MGKDISELVSYIEKCKGDFDSSISSIDDFSTLSNVKSDYLGKKGVVGQMYRDLASFDNDLKKECGSKINGFKDYIEKKLNEVDTVLKEKDINEKINSEKLDITLPSMDIHNSAMHPINKVMEELVDLFSDIMGFSYASGPEIDSEFYIFDSLNTPSHHPARQMQDTFYINSHDKNNNNLLLRTHTSSVQIRSMKQEGVPIKIVSPGKVYRSDWDATHTPMFHQLEGLYVDEDVSLANLKWCIERFLKEFFKGKGIKFRFRSSFFPFTEPSLEVDILRDGDTDWMEIMGCGMVHPNVLRNTIGRECELQGFAFGVGIERLAMIKYKMDDLRVMFGPDFRWINGMSISMFKGV